MTKSCSGRKHTKIFRASAKQENVKLLKNNIRINHEMKPRRKFGEDEEDLIVRLHALLGNRWSLIAGRLPGRTADEVKKHWETHINTNNLLTTITTCACCNKKAHQQPRKLSEYYHHALDSTAAIDDDDDDGGIDLSLTIGLPSSNSFTSTVDVEKKKKMKKEVITRDVEDYETPALLLFR